MAGLVPDLQHILFWMSNSVELLYFIQQTCPLYMQSLEEELDVTGAAVLPLRGGGGSRAGGVPRGGSGGSRGQRVSPRGPRLQSAART